MRLMDSAEFGGDSEGERFQLHLHSSLVKEGDTGCGAAGHITHLAIGAHPDDLEIIGIDGISQCLDSKDLWFGGIVMTGGAGSPRSRAFVGMSETDFVQLRSEEQRKAARLGGYGLLVEFGLASSRLNGGIDEKIVTRLAYLLDVMQPAVVYLHNPFDRHVTHVAACLHGLAALAQANHAPQQVLGVEVWRSLEWLPAGSRVEIDLTSAIELQQQLLGVFESQIQGGKRYDKALVWRNRAHATLLRERQTDQLQACQIAMDLSRFIATDHALLRINQLLEAFREELMVPLEQFWTANHGD